MMAYDFFAEEELHRPRGVLRRGGVSTAVQARRRGFAASATAVGPIRARFFWVRQRFEGFVLLLQNLETTIDRLLEVGFDEVLFEEVKKARSLLF